MDDLLRSVNICEVPRKLVDDVRKMCKAGGFCLKKFIYNEKEVLTTNPEENRGQSVNNWNFITDSLPSERALGIQWNLEHDNLGFCVHLKDTPVTRGGMLSTVSQLHLWPLRFCSTFHTTWYKSHSKTMSRRSQMERPSVMWHEKRLERMEKLP